MTDLRPATSKDVETLALIHVQSWRETYVGLLPADVIAAQTIEKRRALWQKILAMGHSRVWLLDEVGFAQFGPQREDQWRNQGYTEELYAIYVLRSGFGHGRKLLEAAHGPCGQPFTTCVLAENARACVFYKKTGAKWLTTRSEMIGRAAITEHVYGWRRL
ncbi:MAG: hypothetical protein AAFY14_00955 [Pseudomonadota bacterium]